MLADQHPAGEEVRRLPVISSNIASIGWEEGTTSGFEETALKAPGTLEIEFVNGWVYQYFHVPLVTAFMVAIGADGGSVGRTFHRLVRSQPFIYARVSP